eukprot:364678-Chlamydomonas_euryale.AAC.2
MAVPRKNAAWSNYPTSKGDVCVWDLVLMDKENNWCMYIKIQGNRPARGGCPPVTQGSMRDSPHARQWCSERGRGQVATCNPNGTRLNDSKEAPVASSAWACRVQAAHCPTSDITCAEEKGGGAQLAHRAVRLLHHAVQSSRQPHRQQARAGPDKRVRRRARLTRAGATAVPPLRAPACDLGTCACPDSACVLRERESPQRACTPTERANAKPTWQSPCASSRHALKLRGRASPCRYWATSADRRTRMAELRPQMPL